MPSTIRGRLPPLCLQVQQQQQTPAGITDVTSLRQASAINTLSPELRPETRARMSSTKLGSLTPLCPRMRRLQDQQVKVQGC